MTKLDSYSAEIVAGAVARACRVTHKPLVFIAGNGGSGKTELSRRIADAAGEYGHANVIDMDDFVVDTKMRSSATASWTDSDNGVRTGRYTTAFAASYFLQNLNAILFNLEQGNDYYHWPKKARDGNDCRLLYSDAVVTVVDGPGTVFLRKDPTRSLGIFMQCTAEIEIARRIGRGRFSNEKSEEDVRKNFEERTSQYKAMIEPHRDEYGLVLESLADYSLQVIRNDSDIEL